MKLQSIVAKIIGKILQFPFFFCCAALMIVIAFPYVEPKKQKQKMFLSFYTLILLSIVLLQGKLMFCTA